MVDCHTTTAEDVQIKRVQVTDLENAAYLPRGRCIKGMLPGNDNWRSPEAHFKGELNKLTDLFSFGVVCIHAILGCVIFGPDKDGVHCLLLSASNVKFSYFGDQAGIDGLLRHISNDQIGAEVLQMLWEDRNEDNIPYIKFSEWPDVCDAAFKDLIRGLTCLDPIGRITAHQALQHEWFADVE
ncbi:calcium/calmodulin dependent protein kinase [Penicillium concentricum]|uniref:Calcium/calmodulin dependent protein kinase n=1 Tax=Penicillium concentricum TaxID=293559 RepID=A0A9W9SBV3_9EURO|nr:calcium/calmodulin dependent protein kinase [Penicillium concentricum]KAJ5374684.1 calcium/calmodulin dependent protein kinase [Penicillium concentricum]